MQTLTEAGSRQVEAIAARHGFSRAAALTLLDALAAGSGRMAQFSHSELGGMGQWSHGGMIMIGDMFNSGLRQRVAALCVALAGLAEGEAGLAPVAEDWWPAGLGRQAAAGAQNDMRYAWFPAARRLVLRQEGRVRVYDTGEHRISGVAQRQGGGQVVEFAGEAGPVRLEALREVTAEAAAPAEDPLERIRQLAALHREGILTEAEFQAKKAELLGRV